MKKNVLYIGLASVPNSPVGLRYANYIRHLEKICNLTVLNLSDKLLFFSSKGKLENKINLAIRRLPFFPDPSIIVLNAYKKACQKLIVNNKFDTVLIQVLPFSFLYLPKFLKSIDPNLKIIVDMTDPISTNISFRRISNIRYNRLLNLEKSTLAYIDTLVVLNTALVNYYIQHYAFTPVVIEQGIEEDMVQLNGTSLSSNQIIFIYAGHLYKERREPFELYNAIESINSNIKLNIFGSFNKSFIPHSARHFYYGGKLSRKELQSKYCEAHVIVFIDNKTTLQIPGKLLEVLALNKPILFIYYDENSAALKFSNQFDGIYYSVNDSSSIKNAIIKILNDDCYTYKRDLSDYYWKNILNRINNLL